MPSLNFKNRFAPDVETYRKRHSIRAGNRWRKGMMVHAFTDMRTKKCRRLIPATPCTKVEPIVIRYAKGGLLTVKRSGVNLIYQEIKLLAINDGFEGTFDFVQFFTPERGTTFKGQLIHW